MNWVAIVAVGLVATGYLTLITAWASRAGFVRGSMLQAVGSFVIPEPMRRPAIGVLMHILAGLVFTLVYAYIFNFVQPEHMREYMSLGMLIGLVHGFFVSYFMLLGFSSLQSGEHSRPFSFSAAVMNVVAHVTFGFVVGVGLGYQALEGGALLFAAYAAVTLAGIMGLAFLIGPALRGMRRSRILRTRSRDDHWPQTPMTPGMPAIERGP